MLLFAHTGITLGLALGLDKALPKRVPFLRRGEESEGSANPSRLAAVAGAVDYRLVLVGSMLPDIIDKPVGIYLIPSISNGRIFCHTLLFFLVLLLVGLYRYLRYRRTGILVLSLCSGFHLVLDQMWRSPKTLFWPLYGLAFDKYDLSYWLPGMWEALIREPTVYGPEVVGIVILVPVALELLRSGNLLRFLKSGVVKWTTTTS